MNRVRSPQGLIDDSIVSNGLSIIYHPKMTIYNQNDTIDKIFYLEQGLVKSLLVSEDGTQKTLHYVEQRNFLGITSLLRGGEFYGSTVQTVTECNLICFPKEQFWNWYNNNIKFTQLCAASQAEITWSLGKQIGAMTFYNRYSKVASSLVYLAKHYGEAIACDKTIRLRLTHQELAEFNGVSRVTITNVLKYFESKGLILKRSQEIIIHDIELINALVK